MTLKFLLNARCQLVHETERGPDPAFKEEMEDLLDRMKCSDSAFIGKVKELLGIGESEAEDGEETDDAGEIPIVDVHCWYLQDGKQVNGNGIPASKLSKRTLAELWHYMQKPEMPFVAEEN